MVESKAESAQENPPEGERSSAGTSAPGTLPAGKPRSTIGRRAGIVTYWLLITFVIGFGVRSITLQLFWPRADATPPAASCREGLRRLTTELRAFTAGGAAQPSAATPAADHAFFLDWDARQHALDPLCRGDAARAAYGALARYRFSLEQSLARHRREELVLSRDLDARLAALRP